MANTFENPARIHYSHASVPEHIGDLQNEAKNPKLPITSKGEKDLPMQAVVFQRRHITLLNRALRDPDHPLRGAALELMQGFTRAAEREAITTTLNQAAKEYGIPQKNLSEWVAKGLIPYEDRNEYAIYLRRGILDKVAPVYHAARGEGKPAAPILREMHDELFPENSPHPLK